MIFKGIKDWFASRWSRREKKRQDDRVMTTTEAAAPAPARGRTRKHPPKLRELIRVCPGKRQAWFDSSVGPIRKPLAQVKGAHRCLTS